MISWSQPKRSRWLPSVHSKSRRAALRLSIRLLTLPLLGWQPSPSISPNSDSQELALTMLQTASHGPPLALELRSLTPYMALAMKLLVRWPVEVSDQLSPPEPE